MSRYVYFKNGGFTIKEKILFYFCGI